jgi:hypothetical protein
MRRRRAADRQRRDVGVEDVALPVRDCGRAPVGGAGIVQSWRGTTRVGLCSVLTVTVSS